MSSSLKIVFIGGLTNGKIVYDYLDSNRYVNIPLVVTYPDDTDKPRHIEFPDSKSIYKTGSVSEYTEKIKEIDPDFIFVAGWSELLSEELINIPERGTIGFHPSKLPHDRGRSVLAWQIEEGYTETALTMFYYNELPDCGDIIAQEKISVQANDYINDILNKVDDATYNLMRAYFPLLREGKAPRKKQKLAEGNFRRLRDETNSKIYWDRNSEEIFNKIRAISKPYPGAITETENGNKIKIWKAEISDFPYGHDLKPGRKVAELYDGKLIFKTRDGFLTVTEYEQC
ncbi:methionyl-tRNA formyltransferase [Fodinibius halophilus]|uniref:Formyl transferase n=1 Tax=Fodinibius halophilus TaxID=1736908 RepID=A0A6M1T6R1_9BACT|nr:formyltransferase family protein [Fodinibius halophilus]NGP88323.1 formyl transferase [Fodinibius halophilus]